MFLAVRFVSLANNRKCEFYSVKLALHSTRKQLKTIILYGPLGYPQAHIPGICTQVHNQKDLYMTVSSHNVALYLT